jgi:uncharacterized membrane protein
VLLLSSLIPRLFVRITARHRKRYNTANDQQADRNRADYQRQSRLHLFLLLVALLARGTALFACLIIGLTVVFIAIAKLQGQ